MRILIVNDDGINAEGIICLSEMAKEFGEVWVVAPKVQCSGMSHCITFNKSLIVKKEEFPVADVHAFSVTGTPADCVKVGMRVMPEKPDVVFSGINHGYNMGFDVSYSGTVGAAMDALLHGVPAIAYSAKMTEDFQAMGGEFSVAKKYFSIVTRGIFEQEPSLTEIWNVNFPGCALDEVQGVLWNRVPGQKEFYLDHYDTEEIDEDTRSFYMVNIQECTDAQDNSDITAINHKCISVGKIHSIVF